MNPQTNFESLLFKPFIVNEALNLNPEIDPDIDVFKAISSFVTKYVLPSEAKNCVKNFDKKFSQFSILLSGA